MKQLPDCIRSGEPSRLFPVLADTSKEGRTLSIFLSCLENIDEFGRALLGGLGVRLGARAKIDTYTEVVLTKNSLETRHRPDGLIVVSTGKSVWRALVEAKVGSSDLTNEQIEAYLNLAKQNGIDAVITLSNQFTPIPTHHPLTISPVLTRKVQLFHWSWANVITQAHVLIETREVEDREQQILLSELQRFLLHQSSGVKEFDQMTGAWGEVCAKVASGTKLGLKEAETQSVTGSWHQALDQVTTVLSRQIGNHVKLTLSRAAAVDPQLRLKNTAAELCQDASLRGELMVPDAAGPMKLCADLSKRTLTSQMWLKAPTDKVSTKARLSWLLRQLSESDAKNIHIRLYWPGRAVATQHSLTALRNDPDKAASERPGMAAVSFDVLMIKEIAVKFAQRKHFVTELIELTSNFHAQAGSKLSAWQARPPKIAEARIEPSSVSTEALRDQIERDALERE